MHISGSGSGNVLTGGTIEYNLKGGTGVNLQVDSDHNYITAWVEGHSGAGGKNLVVGGNYNTLWLSDLASPSSGMTTNVSVGGAGNNLFGPVIGDPVVTSYGAISVNGTNFINNNPVAVNAGPLTFACDVGTPTTISGTARYKKLGSLLHYEATITTTNIGTCTGALNVTNLPAATSAMRRMSSPAGTMPDRAVVPLHAGNDNHVDRAGRRVIPGHQRPDAAVLGLV